MNKRPQCFPEVRKRAARLVLTSEHEHSSRWVATASVACKIGCTQETLRTGINRREVDSYRRPSMGSDEAQKLKELARENRELKRANAIVRDAAAFFAQAEFDRKRK